MAQRTRKDKMQWTADLVDGIGDADILYLTDFTGLSVKDMTELRRRFRDAGSRYLVVKNRLALRALEQLDLPDIAEYLRGPTGIVVAHEDPVVPAKTLREFAKDNEDRPTVKVGVVDRRVISADEIQQLASLPPREELLAGIVGSLSAPMAGIVGVLNALLRDVAYMVEEVARQREGGGD